MHRPRTAAWLLALALMLSPPAGGQEANLAPKPPGTEAPAPAGPIAQLHLAFELFAVARRANDPLLAAAAAHLAAGVGQGPERPRSVIATDTGRDEARKSESLGPPDAARLLAEARGMAVGNSQAAALVEAIGNAAAARARGRVSGPGVTNGRVAAQGRVTFGGEETTFRAGEPAEVLLTGDGDADLDLFVMDELGNVVCRADGPTDREYCRWTPRWTGSFRLIVANAGTVWSRFALRTN